MYLSKKWHSINDVGDDRVSTIYRGGLRLVSFASLFFRASAPGLSGSMSLPKMIAWYRTGGMAGYAAWVRTGGKTDFGPYGRYPVGSVYSPDGIGVSFYGSKRKNYLETFIFPKVSDFLHFFFQKKIPSRDSQGPMLPDFLTFIFLTRVGWKNF